MVYKNSLNQSQLPASSDSDSDPFSDDSETSISTLTMTKKATSKNQISLTRLSIGSSKSGNSSTSGSSNYTTKDSEMLSLKEGGALDAQESIIVDDDYQTHLTNQNATNSHGLFYGQQLSDDILNTFVDKIQSAAPEYLEGCLAVQTVQLIPKEIPKLIPGKHRVLQIILDSHRKHFILAEWLPIDKDRGVGIYDSLVTKWEDFEAVLNNSSKSQFKRLFGHLYSEDNNIKLRFETFQEGQEDNWSCGLRAAALFAVKVFYRKPFRIGDVSFNLRVFNDVLRSVVEARHQISEADLQIENWFKLLPPRKLQYVIFTLNSISGEIFGVRQNFQPKWDPTYDESDVVAAPIIADAERELSEVLEKMAKKNPKKTVLVSKISSSNSDCPSKGSQDGE